MIIDLWGELRAASCMGVRIMKMPKMEGEPSVLVAGDTRVVVVVVGAGRGGECGKGGGREEAPASQKT
jgi:hypothetical protein